MGGFATRRPQAAGRVGAVLALAAMTVLHVGSGCAAGNDDAAVAQGGDALAGNLHVLVAASLLPVAEVLAAEFEFAHPGVDVLISGAGSSALREQVLAGAPADVFIPADPAHLDTIHDEVGLASEPVVVARNSLVLAVPASNGAGVTSLDDLARPELLIGLCAAEVPCGALARHGLLQADIQPAPDTDEPNVRALVTKLAGGELDAAVVYASDAAARDSAQSLDAAIRSLGWSAGIAPQASYAAAVLSDAPNLPAASAFVAFLTSDAAADSLADFGFSLP